MFVFVLSAAIFFPNHHYILVQADENWNKGKSCNVFSLYDIDKKFGVCLSVLSR